MPWSLLTFPVSSPPRLQMQPAVTVTFKREVLEATVRSIHVSFIFVSYITCYVACNPIDIKSTFV